MTPSAEPSRRPPRRNPGRHHRLPACRRQSAPGAPRSRERPRRPSQRHHLTQRRRTQRRPQRHRRPCRQKLSVHLSPAASADVGHGYAPSAEPIFRLSRVAVATCRSPSHSRAAAGRRSPSGTGAQNLRTAGDSSPGLIQSRPFKRTSKPNLVSPVAGNSSNSHTPRHPLRLGLRISSDKRTTDSADHPLMVADQTVASHRFLPDHWGSTRSG
jgi:hypothetical protein